MTTSVNKVDNFLEAFPNKVIKHTGRPDYETLNNIKTALKQNFAMVPCTLGGAHMGTCELCSLQQNMLRPHQKTHHHSSTHFSPALVLSSHPTEPDHISPQLNANSTRHYDNGPNIKISQTQGKSSSRTESTICTYRASPIGMWASPTLPLETYYLSFSRTTETSQSMTSRKTTRN